MAKGTDPTPLQLRFRQDNHGYMNKDRGVRQLQEQGVSSESIIKFMDVVEETRTREKGIGQVEVLTTAAEAIGAEAHWI